MWGSPSKGVSTTSCSACQHTDALVGKYLSKVWHLCSGAIHRAMSWTGVSHHFLSQIFNSSLFYCVVVLLLVISGCIPHTTERLSTITHTARLSEVQNYSYYMAFFNVQFFRTLIMVGVKFLEIYLSFSGTQLRAENLNSAMSYCGILKSLTVLCSSLTTPFERIYFPSQSFISPNNVKYNNYIFLYQLKICFWRG